MVLKIRILLGEEKSKLLLLKSEVIPRKNESIVLDCKQYTVKEVLHEFNANKDVEKYIATTIIVEYLRDRAGC